jgi:hypothetical protein
LVLLIFLVIATAVMLAWLLFALTRHTLAELRYPRLHLGLSRTPSAGSETAALAPPIAPEPPPIAPERPPIPADLEAERELVLYDESDAERAVRERLYGGHGRRPT